MLFIWLIKFLRGFVVINISGRFPERFLNVCANRGILIWDVVRLSSGSIRCRISMSAFKMLPPIARKTGVSIDILSKNGLPIILSKYKRRKWFFFGPLIFLLMLFLVNQFVWEIQIVGCDKLLPKQVEEKLAEMGVKKGVLRATIDPKRIKNEMLIKMPELSWIWTDKNGSKLIVNVRESVPAPEIYDINDYCNIVAAKDGLISSAIVKNGTPMFKIGDTVQKNDILVSGLMLSERNIEPRYIRADAQIYARVWYEETEVFPLYEQKKTETGNIQKKRRIKLFGWDFTPFWYKDVAFSDYMIDTDEFELSVFGHFLGMKVTTDVYKEYVTENIPITAESAVSYGVKVLTEKIDTQVTPDSERITYRNSFVNNSDETVSVTVVAEYIEDIAKVVHPQ